MNQRMRFRIVNETNEQKSERHSSKDPSTRQNSATKHQRQNSFLDMVKNNYQFYMTLGKDQLKDEQLKIAAQKQEKIKKMIKKQAMAQERQVKKSKEQRKLARQLKSKQSDQNMKQNGKQKLSTKPSRRSQRSRNPISYAQPIITIEDEQIFDVLDIDYINQLNNKEQKQITKQSDWVVFIQKSDEKPIEKALTKSQAIIEKIEKVKLELIFEQEDRYELGVGHQAMLRAQKFIDQHINFRHQIRQSRFVEITTLMKYLKSHGFITFDQNKFHLLTRINPYLYNFSQTDSKYLMTFKLNGLQIQKRLESTKRRMSQVALPELMT